MYAMRNAALHAKGVDTTPVAPHRMTLSQAAHDTDAIFTITPQHNYGPAPSTTPFPPVWFAGVSSPSRTVSTASVLEPRLSYCHIDWQGSSLPHP